MAATFRPSNRARVILGGGNQIYLWDILVPGSGKAIGNPADDIVIG